MNDIPIIARDDDDDVLMIAGDGQIFTAIRGSSTHWARDTTRTELENSEMLAVICTKGSNTFVQEE